MRILAASDIHGDSKATKKLAERAEREKADLVVLCGDLTGFTESKNLIKPFKDKGQKVLILPGNWDSLATVDFLAQFYGVRNIHGYSATYEDVGFFGAGGAEGPGEGNIGEEEIMRNLEKANSGLKNVKKKIMLTHAHPLGGESEFSGVEGSAAVRAAVEKFKPDFLFHGHIHKGEGLESKIGKQK